MIDLIRSMGSRGATGGATTIPLSVAPAAAAGAARNWILTVSLSSASLPRCLSGQRR